MTELIVTSIPEDDPQGKRRFFEENWKEPPDIEAEVAAATKTEAGKESGASPYPYIRGLVDAVGSYQQRIVRGTVHAFLGHSPPSATS